MMANIQQLINNSVAGIAAGIIVAIVLGVYQLLGAHVERQRQIGYASEMVSSGITRIQNADNDRTRLLYYNRLLRSVEAYLSANEASSRIRYAEKEVLRTALPYSTDGTVIYIASPASLPQDGDAFFEDAVKQFRNIPWLIFAP